MERRKQGQEVAWIQAKEPLSFGLVTSKHWSICVCVERVILTALHPSFPPSHQPAITTLLQVFYSGEPLLFPSGDIPPIQQGGEMKSLRHGYKSSHQGLHKSRGTVVSGKQGTWTYSEFIVNTSSQESGPRTGDT